MATATQAKVSAETATPWRGFRPGLWQNGINVRDFIQENYEPYDGDGSFPGAATPRTQHLEDASGSVRRRAAQDPDVADPVVSLRTHPATSIATTKSSSDSRQTPLKRAIMPNGGFRMVVNA
jgi:formate C-acetyltransferase